MIKSKNEEKMICGINGLGRINYSNKEDTELIDKTLFCFDSLITKQKSIINGVIVQSLSSMYFLRDEIITRLINLSKEDDPHILFGISSFLFKKYNEIKNKSYFDELLFSLTKVNSEYLGTINIIDNILYSLVEDECNTEIVIDFLIEWMSVSDCKPDKIYSLRLLEMTFSGICSKESILHRYLFYFFNDDNIYSPSLAAYIITTSFNPKKQNAYLDFNLIQNLNKPDVLFICRRMLGHVFQPENIFSLFYSLLYGKKNCKDSVDIIKIFFVEHIGHNYPVTTLKNIDIKLEEINEDDTLRNTLLYIKEKVNEIYNERYDKPKLKEFEPKRKDLYLLSREDYLHTNKIMKLAESRSVLHSLVEKSNIKYGTSASYFLNDEFSESSSFITISSSFESAYELHVDRVGFENKILAYKNIKREVICD